MRRYFRGVWAATYGGCLGLFLWSGLLLTSQAIAADAVVPLANAHAHNDYEHKRPLLDALDQGFCSVEADIYLVDGALLVAHNRRDVKPERTLEALYLDPLLARVRENGGRVYRDGPPFTLLIDIKTDGAQAYEVLAKMLARYAEMLTVVRDGQVTPGAVTVVISGDRPADRIAADKIRYAGIDGRLSDLDSDLPANLMPLVSDNWMVHFRWRGKGEIPAAEKELLQTSVAKAHAKGRKVRFWAIPSNPAVWGELAAAGVDLINTDDLPGLAAYLREHAAKP
ncbi:MAG TPA: phosphatidylinositol-specific phospholipase C/glycerophosphodiester phosphodiesterase family protein [Pirellulales bacterium]